VDQHGWLTVVDRLKDVVITGGENVFSVEVEDVLRAHPRVNQAAVCRAQSQSRPQPTNRQVWCKPQVARVECHRMTRRV